MSKVTFGGGYDKIIEPHAEAKAKEMGRGSANIEDQFRSALALLEGFSVMYAPDAEKLKDAIDEQLSAFLYPSLLATESGIANATGEHRIKAYTLLQSFLSQLC